MSPRRPKMSREASGSDLGRISEAFSKFKQRDATETLPTQIAGYAPEQGYRLALRLACFLSLPQDRARKLWKKTHEKLTKRSSSKRPASARSMFSQPSPGSSQKAPKTNARETHETFQIQTPGERAQRASKGCTRPTTLAILMLALLSPRWLRCASWCFALVLLAIVCASLLVFSVACDACGSRFSRASRSSLVRFFWRCFLFFFETLDFFEKAQHHPHENLVFRGPGSPTMEPKLLPKCFEHQAPVRGASGRASGSDLGGFWRPQEAPQRPPGGPK